MLFVRNYCILSVFSTRKGLGSEKTSVEVIRTIIPHHQFRMIQNVYNTEIILKYIYIELNGCSSGGK